MARPPFAVAALVTLLSCGGAPDEDLALDEVVVETSATSTMTEDVDGRPGDALVSDEDVVSGEDGGGLDVAARAGAFDEDGVPRGAFASIAALCAAQMEAAAPRLRAAEQHLQERGDEDFTLVPSCHEDRTALAEASVAPGGPFRDLTAVTFVTEEGTATHLVARTALGFIAIEEPIMLAYHDDPGCPSILRDAGLVEARVTGRGVPTLVVVTSADRYMLDDDEVGASWVEERAAACHLDSVDASISCDAPELIAESVRRDDGRTRHASRASYSVDAEGVLVVGDLDAVR